MQDSPLTNSPAMQYKALTMDHSPALEVTADPDVEIFYNSKLLVDMDPFGRSALFFHGLAFRNERGTIQMNVISNTCLTHPHPNLFTLRCHCVIHDDERMTLHLSKNYLWT
jgi:hypothetical protein